MNSNGIPLDLGLAISGSRVTSWLLMSFQCTANNGVGACPDILQGGTDDVVLQGGFIRNGVTRITVERPLNTSKCHLSCFICTVCKKTKF